MQALTRVALGGFVLALFLASCGGDPQLEDLGASTPFPRAVAKPTADDPHGVPCRVSDRKRGPDKYIPSTYTEAGHEVMPVTFSDGTTAELAYPPELDLASLGALTRTSGQLGDSSDTGRGLTIAYGGAVGFKFGSEPVACYTGSTIDQVELWSSGDDPDVRYWLIFPLGSWTANTWDGNAGKLLRDPQRAQWAANLVGRETEDGWLVLDGTGDLKLGTETDGDVQMGLGNVGKRAVKLWPTQCSPYDGPDAEIINGRKVHIAGDEVGGGQWFGNLCLVDAPMDVHVYGNERFVRAVLAELEARNVHHAHAADKYQIVP